MSDKQLDKDLILTDNFLTKQLILKIQEYEKIIVRKLGNKIENFTIHEINEYSGQTGFFVTFGEFIY